MNILSFMVPTGCFPSLSAWESGGPTGSPRILLGRTGRWGVVLGPPRGKGQGSHPASGKPGLLQASSYLGGCGQVEYGEHA